MNTKIKLFYASAFILTLSFMLSGCKKERAKESEIPELNTTEVTEINQTDASTGGNIISDGGSFVYSRGVVWSTNQYPTIEGYIGILTSGKDTGSFTCNIKSLNPNTTYYVRAFATNSIGTAYGNQFSFTTFVGDGTVGTVTYNGDIYKTVWVGNKEWMAENLKTTKYRNGDNIPGHLTLNEWTATSSGAYATYPYAAIEGFSSETEVLNAYGALYNFYAIVDEKGLCPEGWRVTSDEDWTEMVSYLVDRYEGLTIANVGYKLKSCRQINSPLGLECSTSIHPRWAYYNNTYVNTDDYGFSALPGGLRYASDGAYSSLGFGGYWWTTTLGDTYGAWIRSLSHGGGGFYRAIYNDKYGFSVRCIKE